jgi:hypothetical protein
MLEALIGNELFVRSVIIGKKKFLLLRQQSISIIDLTACVGEVEAYTARP